MSEIFKAYPNEADKVEDSERDEKSNLALLAITSSEEASESRNKSNIEEKEVTSNLSCFNIDNKESVSQDKILSDSIAPKEIEGHH